VAIFEKYLTARGYEYANDMDELQAYHAAYSDMLDEWRSRFAVGIHDVNVGDLAANHSAEVRKLLEFCGLPWSEACLGEARSEPQHRDWPRDRIASNRAEHLAAWREVRPQLWGSNA
jgi:hypothetical protein